MQPRMQETLAPAFVADYKALETVVEGPAEDARCLLDPVDTIFLLFAATPGMDKNVC